MIRLALSVIGSLTAWIAYYLGIRKYVTFENLRRAYPELSENQQKLIAIKSYSNLGIVFAEMLYLRFAGKENIQKHITVSNPQLFHKYIKEENGLIVVAGHFANWEWLAVGGALVLHENFAIVRKNIPTSFAEKFLEKMRIRSGNSLINSGDIRRMFSTLQNGKCIALLADQAAPANSCKVRFFGREVPTFEGPARLALRTKSPMLFAECIRGINGDYIITFHDIPHTDLIEDSVDNIKELTYRHTHLLEDAIRRHPDQWLWQHRRWKNA